MAGLVSAGRAPGPTSARRRAAAVVVAVLVLTAAVVGTAAGPALATPTGVTVSGPWGIAVNPAADSAYAASRTGNSLVPVSGAGVAGSAATTGSFPLGAVYNPFNGYVYVANYSGGSVSVVNPATATVVTTVSTTGLGSVGNNPYWVDVDAATGNVVVSFYSAGATVGVISPTNVLSSLALPAGQSGDSHVGVTVDSSAHVAYVSDSTAGLVDVVPLSGAAPSTVTVGGSPAGIVRDSGNGKVYVGFASGSVVKAIDTANANAVSAVAVGNTPSGLAVAPATHAVFTTNNGDGTLSVVDGSTGAVTNSVTPGGANDYLTWAATDETNNRLYIGDFTAGKVFIAAPADTEVTPTLTLAPSSSSVAPGASVTYTATESTGTQPISFYDTTSGSTPIASCVNVALTGGSATCTVPYASAGSYSVTARVAEKRWLYAATSSPAAAVTVATASPSPTAPAAPAPVTAAPGNGTATLTFGVPASNGSAVTGYEYSLDGGATWTVLTTTVGSGGQGAGTITNLTNGAPYSVLLRARNAVGPSPASAAVSVTPSGTGPKLTGTSLPEGRVGRAYSSALGASGGTSPYTFTASAGALPQGLALADDGTVSGMPTKAGSFTVTVTVTDAASATATTDVPITVNRPTAATLGAIKRSSLIKVPADPDSYRSRTQHLTKAWRASANGTDAHPMTALKGLDLIKGQAATLSGDGLFGFDSPKLTAAGKAQVKLLAASLKPEAGKVRCEGYTDYAGEKSHEKTLSAQRAKAVCDVLKQDGAGVTTTSVGYGPKHPAAVGGKARARKENRRVVVLVTA